MTELNTAAVTYKRKVKLQLYGQSIFVKTDTSLDAHLGVITEAKKHPMAKSNPIKSYSNYPAALQIGLDRTYYLYCFSEFIFLI